MGQFHSWNSIKKSKDFSYNRKSFIVKVVDIYDGDTGRMVFRDNLRLNQYKFRLYGIDTPEIRPLLSLKNREQEIKKAKKAKKFLSDLVLNKVIYVKCLEFDKYGRILVNLYKNRWNKKSINDLMIDEGLGKVYFGGTK